MTYKSQTLSSATDQLYNLIYAGLHDARGTHLETAIAAAATLAGYQIQRDSSIDLSTLTPGSPVFTLPGVDDNGPIVIDYIVQACHNSGIRTPPSSDPVPVAHGPLLSYLQLMEKLASAYRQLIDPLPIKPEMRWVVPAQTAVRFIVAGQNQVPPATAQALAIECIVAAAKTVPPKLY